MINTEQAINRLYSIYGKHGITRELITSLFMDGIEKQGFTPLDTYNLLRMSLGHEFNEREYFAVAEIADMLGISENEVVAEAKEAQTGNEALINGFRMYFPKGIQ